MYISKYHHFVIDLVRLSKMDEEQVFFSTKESKITKSKSRINKNLIKIFLFIYWIGVFSSFILYNRQQDVLTKISNNLQLILNTCALTVCLVNPVLKNNVYIQILKCLKQYDANISILGLKLEYKKTNFRHILAFFAIVIYLVYLVTYDIFISIYVHEYILIPYFIITRFSKIIYYLAMFKVMCLLHSINRRFRLINKILKAEQLEEKCSKNVGNIEVQRGLSKKENFPQILFVMDYMKDLCLAVNLYYGSLFLMCFITMFVVSAIQLYYCYTLIIEIHLDIYSLILSINIICINFFFVIGISTLCQQITDKVKFFFFFKRFLLFFITHAVRKSH